jgi:N-methylhydantoinase A
MKLDAGAALEACTALGERIDLSPTDVAWGIREIALQGMVQAVHARLADRGVAAGDSAVVSYGGCGGLFTGDIARAIGVPRVLFPEIASVLSAFGANTTDIRRERTASFSLLLPTDPGDLAAAAERLRVLVDGDLAADLVAPEHRTVRFEAGVKFKGQPHELLLPIATPDIDTAALEQLEADFYDRYARRYGPAAVSSRIPVEVVTLRAVGTGRTARATLHGARFTRSHDLVGGPAAASRPVTLRQGEGPVDVPTFWLHDLDSGGEVTGPALLDGSDTTLWIPDGATGVVTPERTLSLSVGRAPSGGTA